MSEKELQLPENARRELRPGETYTPVIHQEKGVLEVTARSVMFGFAITVIFSMAAAYIALKLGQGIETAIPIAILAVGFSAMLARIGVLFLIPFRRYFVSEMHGKLPFPEATATTEILMTGEKGGSHAKILAYSMGIGAIFDFLGPSMHAWAENFTTSMVGFFNPLTTYLWECKL